MTFPGKPDEPKKARRVQQFRYTARDMVRVDHVEAHDVYFYASGLVGFWRVTDDGDAVLVRAVRTDEVWTEEA